MTDKQRAKLAALMAEIDYVVGCNRKRRAIPRDAVIRMAERKEEAIECLQNL